MTRASPQTRLLAKQLQSFEQAGNTSAGTGNVAVFGTTGKLLLSLAELMGPVGCSALLARSVKLAALEVHWLISLRVGEDGNMEGLSGILASVSDAEVSDGEVVLLSQLIGLLVAFIGPALTLRLIKQLWPQLMFDNADFSKASTHKED
jgi:hypothetical protein